MRTALAVLAVAALVAGGYFFNGSTSSATGAPTVNPEAGGEGVVVRPTGEYNPTPVAIPTPPPAEAPGGGCGGH